jgi:hypothetical protein
MRKTSEDYRKDLSNARNKLETVEARVKVRLMSMVEQNPDAVIKESGEDKFKARCVTKSYIDQLSTDTMIEFIRRIEEHNANLEPYIQMSMYT